LSSRTAHSKREQARLAAKQAEQARARRARLAVVGALAVVGLAVVGLVVAQQDDDGGTATTTSAPSGGLLTSAPPWPAQAQGLAERVAPLGFPPVGDESYHAHALLTVYRDGEQVPVPADLGYDTRGAHSSLHTHTPDGVIHMEADDPYPYTLAHVMTTWGVAFDETTLGGDRAAGDKKVYVYVNGRPAGPDAPLKDGDNVVVAYGTEGSFPTQPDDSALDSA
jgi:hypothetical protein